jgi:hypothetical protein
MFAYGVRNAWTPQGKQTRSRRARRWWSLKTSRSPQAVHSWLARLIPDAPALPRTVLSSRCARKLNRASETLASPNKWNPRRRRLPTRRRRRRRPATPRTHFPHLSLCRSPVASHLTLDPDSKPPPCAPPRSSAPASPLSCCRRLPRPAAATGGDRSGAHRSSAPRGGRPAATTPPSTSARTWYAPLHRLGSFFFCEQAPFRLRKGTIRVCRYAT